MEKQIIKLAKKYLRGECTRKEAEVVLAWFDTAEGQNFLSKRLDEDLDELDEYPAPGMYSQVPTSKMKYHINREREQVQKEADISKVDMSHRRIPAIVATAASILLLIASSILFYQYSHTTNKTEQLSKQPVTYNSGTEHHKILSLSDGSTVRLNSNSQLIVPDVFQGNKREVTLKGEAYFNINSNPQKPFIVNTDQTVIQVLGTAFNVKTDTDSPTTQVAVKEGSVSFRKNSSSPDEAVVLQKNQLGYLESGTRDIKVDQGRIDNYLSWMSKRLVFVNTPFPKVCTQLERIYGIDCSISDKQLSSLHFTANFERRSLERTLEIIANSLEISYKLNGNELAWTSH